MSIIPPAPGVTDATHPSFRDAASGNAPFSEGSLVSTNPIIVRTPVTDDVAGGTSVSMPVTVNLTSFNIGALFDPSQINHIIEERERFLARRMVIMADSGVSF